MKEFRYTILSLLPLDDPTELQVAPPTYLDDDHAFAYLPFGMTDDESKVSRGRMMSRLIVPMLLEDSEWRVVLPSWRLLEQPRQE